MTERDGGMDPLVERRLSRAFEAELDAARADLERRPLRPAPARPASKLAIASLAVVLAVSGGLVFQAIGLVPAVPGDQQHFRTPVAPVETTAAPSPTSPVPARLEMGDVLTVPAALERLAGTQDDAPFLVGGWLDIFENTTAYCTDHPMTGCKERLTASSTSIAPALWVSFDGRRPPPTGWVVLRGHVHDDRAAACQAGWLRDECEATFVVEAVDWSQPGDGSEPTPAIDPSPRPTDPPTAPPTNALAAIPTTVFARPVLSPGEARNVLPTHTAAESILVGGRLEHTVVECGDPSCPVVGVIRDVDDPAITVEWEHLGSLDPLPDLAVIVLRAHQLIAMLGRVLWRDSGRLPADAPSTIDGETVLTVSQAIREADTSTARTPFLVGGWFRRVPGKCTAPGPAPTGGTPRPPACLPGYAEVIEAFTVGDTSVNVPAIPVTSNVTDLERRPFGPAVLRVHAIQPSAAECATADRLPCPLVVEDVAWEPGQPVSTVREQVGQTTFERPGEWTRWLPNEHAAHTSGPTTYFTTEVLSPECAVRPGEPQNPPGPSGLACEWPLAGLSENGVLITWMGNRTLQELPTAGGEPFTMNGQSTRLVVERPGHCAEIGGEMSMSVVVPLNHPSPLSNVSVVACLRGPDIDAAEAQVREMLRSARLTGS